MNLTIITVIFCTVLIALLIVLLALDDVTKLQKFLKDYVLEYNYNIYFKIKEYIDNIKRQLIYIIILLILYLFISFIIS